MLSQHYVISFLKFLIIPNITEKNHFSLGLNFKTISWPNNLQLIWYKVFKSFDLI